MLCVLLTAVLGIALLPEKHIECSQDNIHIITSNLHLYFKEEVETRNALMIICGLMMDSIVIITFTMFIWKGTTWRIMLALLMFYVAKFISSVIYSKLKTLFSDYSCRTQ